MAGERNYNPVQAQRKADKAKAIKKGKPELPRNSPQRFPDYGLLTYSPFRQSRSAGQA